MILNEIKNAFSSSTYHYESLKEKFHKELKITYSSSYGAVDCNNTTISYTNYIPLESIAYITKNFVINPTYTYTTSTSMAEPTGRLYYMDSWDNTLSTTN